MDHRRCGQRGKDETEGLSLGDREIEEKVCGPATWVSGRCLAIDLKHGVITNRGAQGKNWTLGHKYELLRGAAPLPQLYLWDPCNSVTLLTPEITSHKTPWLAGDF